MNSNSFGPETCACNQIDRKISVAASELGWVSKTKEYKTFDGFAYTKS